MAGFDPQCTPPFSIFVSKQNLGHHVKGQEHASCVSVRCATCSGQDVQFNIREHPHVDYSYAVTSHSSQGATADRVLVHVDTEQAHDQLIVSGGGGRCSADLFCRSAAFPCL